MKHTLSQITAGFESDRFALQNQLEDIKKENSLLKNEAEKVRLINFACRQWIVILTKYF